MLYARIKARIRVLKDGFCYLSINPRLGVMYRALKRPGKGGRKDRIQCAYFGFNSETEAQTFMTWLKAKHDDCFPQLREPERLSDVAFEVKVREFPGLLDIVLQCAVKQQETIAHAA